jgi:hypothetical protein
MKIGRRALSGRLVERPPLNRNAYDSANPITADPIRVLASTADNSEEALICFDVSRAFCCSCGR